MLKDLSSQDSSFAQFHSIQVATVDSFQVFSLISEIMVVGRRTRHYTALYGPFSREGLHRGQAKNQRVSHKSQEAFAYFWKWTAFESICRLPGVFMNPRPLTIGITSSSTPNSTAHFWIRRPSPILQSGKMRMLAIRFFLPKSILSIYERFLFCSINFHEKLHFLWNTNISLEHYYKKNNRNHDACMRHRWQIRHSLLIFFWPITCLSLAR